MTTTNRIMTALMAFFDGSEWSYDKHEEKPILKLGFSGNNGRWTCFAQVRELDEQFVFYSICPLSVPAPKRPVIAELLTRANYGLIIGNFEMDMDDGEIRYKSSLDLEGGELSSEMIKNAVYASVITLDRYLPAISAVLDGNASAKQAIDEIEDDDGDDMSKS